MNTNRLLKAAFVALLGLALAVSTGKAQTFLTNDIINTFDAGGNTSPFSNSGSVKSWIYWFNAPGGNLPMTNDPSMDAGGDPTSGSLLVVSPLTNSTQNQFFGTFDNGGGYDLRSQEANLLNYSSVSFDIRFASNTVLSSSTNLGTIAVIAVSQDATFNVTTSTLTNGMVIPAQAETNWVHMVVPIDHTLPGLTAVGGIGFNYNSFSGYPKAIVTNWIDNLVVHSGAPPPPPPTLASPTKALSGLNCIGTVGGSGGQFNRYQLATVNDNGYTFVGQNSVTYSWTIKQFPQKTGTSFQQHVFLVNGAPGPFDQAADYNLADCIFLTVQQNDAGTAFFNFRYKTNEPGGNAMLFNGTDNANGVTYPVAGAPKQPACSLTDSNGAMGTWSITFAQTTNVTITGPGGVTTNFVFDPAAAALFADPMTVLVGGQPNNTTGGQILVYSNFSATGCTTPINDNFSADASLDTNTWKNFSSDTNGCVLAPAGASLLIGWSLPDIGFSLQTTGVLKAKSNTWSSLSSLGTIQDNGKRVVLVNTSNLLNTNMSYFSLIKRVFTQLQVILPGETAAPGTPTGKTGTPDSQAVGATFNVIVNAVDANWFPISGVTDSISLTSTDPQFLPPLAASLVNGTVTLQVQMGSSGSWTITATDNTDNTKTANTSSTIVVP